MFSSDWFDAKKREIRPSTQAAYEFELKRHLLPFFKDHQLSEITPREIDRYKQAQMRRAEKGARLSNTMINMTLGRLAQILDDAVDYGLIASNPARGKRRRLKTQAVPRTHMDRAEHIDALLTAAGKLDAEARGDRGGGRRALLATLTFAGLRIGEALDLRWRDVDLAAGRLHVGRSKTDAGVREVDLLPVLRDELAAHKAAAASTAPSGLVQRLDPRTLVGTERAAASRRVVPEIKVRSRSLAAFAHRGLRHHPGRLINRELRAIEFPGRPYARTTPRSVLNVEQVGQVQSRSLHRPAVWRSVGAWAVLMAPVWIPGGLW